MKNKKNNTSKILEQHILNQQFQQLQQQLQHLTQQVNELEQLHLDLSNLNTKKDSKTYSSIGGGIFIETESKKSELVLLSVGANIIVKKPRKKAIEIIEKQKGQLEDIKNQLESELNKLNLKLMSTQ